MISWTYLTVYFLYVLEYLHIYIFNTYFIHFIFKGKIFFRYIKINLPLCNVYKLIFKTLMHTFLTVVIIFLENAYQICFFKITCKLFGISYYQHKTVHIVKMSKKIYFSLFIARKILNNLEACIIIIFMSSFVTF